MLFLGIFIFGVIFFRKHIYGHKFLMDITKIKRVIQVYLWTQLKRDVMYTDHFYHFIIPFPNSISTHAGALHSIFPVTLPAFNFHVTNSAILIYTSIVKLVFNLFNLTYQQLQHFNIINVNHTFIMFIICL